MTTRLTPPSHTTTPLTHDHRFTTLHTTARHRHPTLTALKDKRGSPLFRHELAYVLGQMQDVRSKPTLMEVLRDTTDEPIVRHEVRGRGLIDRASTNTRCPHLTLCITLSFPFIPPAYPAMTGC